MKKPGSPAPRRRRGSVAVETGIVLPLFLLLVLGTFEYSRFVMLRNLTDNAVREGARTAVVHTYDYTTAQVQSVVTAKLAGQEGQIGSLNIQVFKADPVTGANIDAWTNARFGDWIMVRITGNYTPAVPRLLYMGNTIAVTANAMMRCEAN
jgi:Flp pilus assembly protein TadG